MCYLPMCYIYTHTTMCWWCPTLILVYFTLLQSNYNVKNSAHSITLESVPEVNPYWAISLKWTAHGNSTTEPVPVTNKYWAIQLKLLPKETRCHAGLKLTHDKSEELTTAPQHHPWLNSKRKLTPEYGRIHHHFNNTDVHNKQRMYLTKHLKLCFILFVFC